ARQGGESGGDRTAADRGGPGPGFRCHASGGSCDVQPPPPAYDPVAYKRELERSLEPPAPPPLPKPTPERTLPSEWHPVRVQTRPPTANDPGQIVEGKYGIAGDMVFVEDEKGDPIARQILRSGQDAGGVARTILRNQWRDSSPNVPGFYDPIIPTKH